MAGICKIEACPQRQTCRTHCIYSGGFALARFLAGCDTIDTQIGGIRPTVIEGKKIDALISGVLVDETMQPATTLSLKFFSIDKEYKINRTFGRSSVQVLLAYLDRFGQHEERDKLVSMLHRIYDDKLMVIPFKPGEAVQVLNKTGKWENMTITSVTYQASQLDGKIECVLTAVDKKIKRSPAKKLSLVDYGKTFRSTRIESLLYDGRISRKCVSATPFGWMKPIIFTYKDPHGNVEEEFKNAKLIVDGTYIYLDRLREGVEVVGCWHDNSTILRSDTLIAMEHTGLYKGLLKHIEYISRHRRYIAPYMFVDPTVVLIVPNEKAFQTSGSKALTKGEIEAGLADIDESARKINVDEGLGRAVEGVTVDTTDDVEPVFEYDTQQKAKEPKVEEVPVKEYSDEELENLESEGFDSLDDEDYTNLDYDDGSGFGNFANFGSLSDRDEYEEDDDFDPYTDEEFDDDINDMDDNDIWGDELQEYQEYEVDEDEVGTSEGRRKLAEEDWDTDEFVFSDDLDEEDDFEDEDEDY